VRITAWLLGLAVALSIGGCYTRARAGYVTYVDDTPPPQPYVEVTPPAPGDDYEWVNGYWYWNGVEYVWIGGHWASRPAPGYVWVRSGWVTVDGSYRFVPGRWSVESRRPVVRYVHPRPVVRAGPAYRTVHPRRGTVVQPTRRQPARVRVRR